MIETILTICALTMIAPYYDCSEEWDIIIWDESHSIIPGTESAIGTATFDRSNGKNDKIQLVHDHKDREGRHDYLLIHPDVLSHEILHLYCQCNWHEWYDENEGKRISKINSFGMRIPETIIPYIVEEYRR